MAVKETQLFAAAKQGRVKLVQQLLDAGASVDKEVGSCMFSLAIRGKC